MRTSRHPGHPRRRLCSVAIGHASLITLDLRGVQLGVKDYQKLGSKTKYTRVQACRSLPFSQLPPRPRLSQQCEYQLEETNW